MKNIYRTIARIVPSWTNTKLKEFLSYSSIRVDPEDFIGFVILSSLLLGLGGGFLAGYFLQKPFWVFFVALTLCSYIVVYLWLSVLADKKARLVEESLPDALQLMSSNLKAGMTADKALFLSSRPEFGPLKDEIDVVGRKVMLGKNIDKAMMEMARRVRSKRLMRAVELITSGMNSGGSLAILLESTASDLREQFLVDKKIKASIAMYVIFIFTGAALISPALFGLSSFLVEVIRTTLAQIDIPNTATVSLPITLGKITISTEFVIYFALAFLVINAFMASMLLGLIGTGKQKGGLRYFIPMILLAIPIFLVTRYAIKSLLGGLFKF